MVERRRWGRFPVAFHVSFSGDDVVGEGTAVDLSKGGVGITVVTEQTLPPGTHLKVQLCLPDDEPPLQVELASVRWAAKKVFGLQLLFMGTNESDRLDRFITSLEAEQTI